MGGRADADAPPRRPRCSAPGRRAGPDRSAGTQGPGGGEGAGRRRVHRGGRARLRPRVLLGPASVRRNRARRGRGPRSSAFARRPGRAAEGVPRRLRAQGGHGGAARRSAVARRDRGGARGRAPSRGPRPAHGRPQPGRPAAWDAGADTMVEALSFTGSAATLRARAAELPDQGVTEIVTSRRGPISAASWRRSSRPCGPERPGSLAERQASPAASRASLRRGSRLRG